MYSLKTYLTHQTLRFRRWSRKGYAAFASIKRAVTIGQLAFAIADRFHAKQLSLHTGIHTDIVGGDQQAEEECSAVSELSEQSVSLAWLLMNELAGFGWTAQETAAQPGYITTDYQVIS